MKQATSPKIAFNKASVTKCVCPNCPVQAKSQCVSGKMATIGTALKSNPLKREDIPGLYCSSGTATCRDLNPKQSCICGTCPIFSEYKLAAGQPVGYYCRDGSAR